MVPTSLEVVIIGDSQLRQKPQVSLKPQNYSKIKMSPRLLNQY